jgi:carbonic anhydrase/acetyltransferase-like protein (isoleucine patch superfamily)
MSVTYLFIKTIHTTMADLFSPKVHESCFVAPNATILGDVEIEENCGIWYGAVVRGDCGKVLIKAGSNVQDNCVIHQDEGTNVEIGKNVTIGHGAIVHGAKVGDNVVIGMKATILNDAIIGDYCIVGAGAVVKSGMCVPDNCLVLGIPARIVKENGNFAERALSNAMMYQSLKEEHKKNKFPQYKCFPEQNNKDQE